MIECIKYTPVNKSTCLGFATIFIEKWGVEIYGIALHQKDGKKWVNFPAKVYEKEGVTKYLPYFRFPIKEHYIAFCEAVKKAIEKHALQQENSDVNGNVADLKKELSDIKEEEIPF
jgi:hypothetical protein